jgi:hypothetical protein
MHGYQQSTPAQREQQARLPPITAVGKRQALQPLLVIVALPPNRSWSTACW